MAHVIEVRVVALASGQGVEIETPYGVVFVGVYPDTATIELQDGRVITLTDSADTSGADERG